MGRMVEWHRVWPASRDLAKPLTSSVTMYTFSFLQNEGNGTDKYDCFILRTSMILFHFMHYNANYQLFNPYYFEYTVLGTSYTLTVILMEILQEGSSIPACKGRNWGLARTNNKAEVTTTGVRTWIQAQVSLTPK